MSETVTIPWFIDAGRLDAIEGSRCFDVQKHGHYLTIAVQFNSNAVDPMLSTRGVSGLSSSLHAAATERIKSIVGAIAKDAVRESAALQPMLHMQRETIAATKAMKVKRAKIAELRATAARLTAEMVPDLGKQLTDIDAQVAEMEQEIAESEKECKAIGARASDYRKQLQEARDAAIASHVRPYRNQLLARRLELLAELTMAARPLLDELTIIDYTLGKTMTHNQALISLPGIDAIVRDLLAEEAISAKAGESAGDVPSVPADAGNVTAAALSPA